MPTLAEILQQSWQVHQSGNVDAAMQMYRGVLRQVPESADAWVYLGIAQFDKRDFAGAVDSYQRAIGLRSHFPIAWNNLGNAFRMLGDVDQAEHCFDQALQQQPGYLSAIKNRGTLWIWNGEIERGLKWYEEGLAIEPQNAELHRNLGVISLLLGDYERGWNEYRWRWRMPGVGRPEIASHLQSAGGHVPVWSGQPLNGKTVLIYPEQGLGDAIHFLRVARALSKEADRVMVVCPPKLIPLFSSAVGSDGLGIERLIPDVDAHSAAMSLPAGVPVDYQGSFLEVLDGLYQRDGELYDGAELFRWTESKSHAGYLSVPESTRHYWQNSLSPLRQPAKKLIGLNWQGNPEHHADVYRSVPLEAFRSVVESESLTCVSLQFGHGTEQLDQSDLGQRIHRLPPGMDQSSGQFVDTAAVLYNLDALVTTDTAIAHLAGSLGVRTILLLGKVPDWRWLRSGESTRWYPSVEIVRQPELGSWEPCIDAVLTKLA
ncbi:tetratricopeptide repeat protein [Rhodopirellula halodulae]|uniref:tetratricopeptide repeat-containing glycosyltransferase family protein n=1 Tax=Rhodopirellula halodulae TaxID=2894198 RepID=UPI001E3E24CD|nr:tetratricopeptide repeat-containing glycosyltransferase family protein [Rhodopirellula sp. JC737]MCC9654398.1 tetratricopeptide repeat-containing glycosyltransferase family protein [Rhodopirellula sp. JC737]